MTYYVRVVCASSQAVLEGYAFDDRNEALAQAYGLEGEFQDDPRALNIVVVATSKYDRRVERAIYEAKGI